MKRFLLAVLILLALPSLTTAQTNTTADVDTIGQTQCTAVLNTNMRYRMRDSQTNNEVSALQDFLNVEGYLASQPTGFFGLATLNAVKKFQSASGFVATGYVGPLTRAKINAMSCGTGVTATPTQYTSVPTPQVSTRPIPPTQSSLPTGCSSTVGFSVTTGQRCSTSATTLVDNQSNIAVSEQVICAFKSQTEQKCWGEVPSISVGSPATFYSCSGVGTCLINIKGKHGMPITWGSSCGGSANTTIDGNNEYASFSGCSLSNLGTPAPVIKGVNQNINDNYVIIISGANFSPTSNEVKIDGKTHSIAPSKDGFTISFNDHGISGRKMFQVVTSVGSNVVYADIVSPTTATIPSVTLIASPTSVAYGGQSTLTWASTNATSCKFTEGDNQFKNYENTTSGKARYTQSLYAPQVYTIVCADAKGTTATQSVTVNVASATVSDGTPSAPTFTIAVSPASVAYGEKALISWTDVRNADSCTYKYKAEDGSSGQSTINVASGSYNGTYTRPLYSSLPHTVECTGPGGLTTKSVTITVATSPSAVVAPTLTFTAVPSTVSVGQSATLAWSSTNATSCTGYENGSSAQFNPNSIELSGSVTQAMSETKTYTFACTGPGGSITKSVTVTVN